MIQRTIVALRRGQPKPGPSTRHSKFQLVPRALRLVQGGQQEFHGHQLRALNDAAAAARRQTEAGTGAAAATADIRLTEAEFASNRMVKHARGLDDVAEQDQFESRRGYNELAALEEFKAARGEPMPGTISSNADFEARHGYSMVKTEVPSAMQESDTKFGELDLWAELPKYPRGTYFLYLVARRRNAYAVIYDYNGKRVLPTYSAGNRGLKGTDKGLRGDGSPETAHAVTSQYLNDALPKLYELEMAAGRMKASDTGRKIPIVVRVLGFYNGRQGSIRALNDRSDAFDVRHFEDITPFPLNGPRMPKSKFG